MIRFHYFKQKPTRYINQKFRFYFPYGNWRCGIGVLIMRREFSIIRSQENSHETATNKEYVFANPIEDNRYYGDDGIMHE